MPTGVRSPSPLRAPLPGSSTDLETRPLLLSSSAQQIRRPLSRRITEIDENEYSEGPAVVTNSYFPSPNSARGADDSSEEEETEGPLEVVENDPFSQSKRFSLRHEVSPGAVEHTPKLNDNPTWVEWSGATESPDASIGKKGWSTRTDANLKASRSQDSSESEPETIRKPPLPSRGAKLRKGRSQTTALASSSGWQTDAPPFASPRTSVRRKKKTSVAELKGRDGGYTDGELDANNSTPAGLPSRSPVLRLNHSIFYVHPHSRRMDVAPFQVHGTKHFVMSVAISPDGKCIGSGSSDKTIWVSANNAVRLWDVPMWQSIGEDTKMPRPLQWTCRNLFKASAVVLPPTGAFPLLS
ncbi:hypothetical protein EV424DRAFT_1545751 [Suillus variegatus]|nr:hypothetical protein EV424DRAFT_1545751 [Suillus variegatus]